MKTLQERMADYWAMEPKVREASEQCHELRDAARRIGEEIRAAIMALGSFPADRNANIYFCLDGKRYRSEGAGWLEEVSSEIVPNTLEVPPLSDPEPTPP